MNHHPGALVLAAAMLALPASANAQVAYAQVAYTAKNVHLRAGPARDYPVVAILGSGVAVTVQGCMQDYSWCDVIAGELRGWVYAGNLVYSYQGANVPVIDYGAVIGFGVVTFIIGSYWHDHYIDRPWYRQMPQWSHRPPRADVHPRPQHPGPHPRNEQRPVPAYRTPPPPPGTGVAPRPPHAGPRPDGERRPAPSYRTPPPPPGTGVAPRQPHVEPRPEGERRPAPSYRPDQRQPSTDVHPRPPQTGARP